VKTTGGRGLHVIVPLTPHADWTQCLDFSRALSERFEQAQPELYTTAFAKAGRSRKNLIDYPAKLTARTHRLRLTPTARAGRGRTVSMPITWEELRVSLDALRSFTVLDGARATREVEAREPWAATGFF
jgi:bifunctional non-homologous end joining protein LigD